MSDVPFPNAESVSFALNTTAPKYCILTNEELGTLMHLIFFVAMDSVHGRYSNRSDDPKIPDDDDVFARITNVGVRRWRGKLKGKMARFFISDGKHWRLKDWSVVRYTRSTGRTALSAETKRIAVARGGGRCAYCGDNQGPFENDHLYPLSRGGTDDPNNIVLACVPCNREKRDMTLQEWMEARNG